MNDTKYKQATLDLGVAFKITKLDINDRPIRGTSKLMLIERDESFDRLKWGNHKIAQYWAYKLFGINWRVHKKEIKL